MPNGRNGGVRGLVSMLGFDWHDRDVLYTALTHSSYIPDRKETKNNQRLEFLGDAVLELVVSEYLFRHFPMFPEGDLTKMRAAIVCEHSLARAARDIKLGECLFMGRGEEASGGRERPSILADAFEALLGSVYLDQGLEAARRFVCKVLGQVITDVTEGRADRDYKTELQEILQKKSGDPLIYSILKEEGPPHDRMFTAAVSYKGRQLGTGNGHSKKEAEQRAARNALEEMSFDE